MSGYSQSCPNGCRLPAVLIERLAFDQVGRSVANVTSRRTSHSRNCIASYCGGGYRRRRCQSDSSTGRRPSQCSNLQSRRLYVRRLKTRVPHSFHSRRSSHTKRNICWSWDTLMPTRVRVPHGIVHTIRIPVIALRIEQIGNGVIRLREPPKLRVVVPSVRYCACRDAGAAVFRVRNRPRAHACPQEQVGKKQNAPGFQHGRILPEKPLRLKEKPGVKALSGHWLARGDGSAGASRGCPPRSTSHNAVACRASHGRAGL